MQLLLQSKTSSEPFFLPYQRKWIQDSSPRKLMQKSRQVGISWATAYACVRRTSAARCPHDTWVSSRDDTQARLFLEDARHFARILDLATGSLDPASTSHRIAFPSGRSIHSLSSNPDAQAGKRGTRVLDEFALHPNPRQLYAVALPGTTWGGQLEIISTHRGALNFFNSLVHESLHAGNPKRFSLHTVTLEHAVSQGLLRKLQPKLPLGDPRKSLSESNFLDFTRSQCPDEATWLQEFLCVPADDASSFLPWDSLAACEYPVDHQWEHLDPKPSSSTEYYLGVDVARVHDLSVFLVLQRCDSLALTRHLLCMRNVPFAQQEHHLDRLLANPNLRRACIDATGLGRQFAERAAERFGKHRIEPIQLSAPVKEQLAYPLRNAIETTALRLPPDPDLRHDLRSVKKEVTAAGHFRFTAEIGKEHHADRFWALALALHAMGKRSPLSRIHTYTHAEAIARPTRFPRL